MSESFPTETLPEEAAPVSTPAPADVGPITAPAGVLEPLYERRPVYGRFGRVRGWQTVRVR